MATKRRAEAVWRPEHEQWELKVQKDGVRKHFSSPIKGRKGKHEAENLADAWLQTGTEDMKAEDAWRKYIEYLKEKKSLSAYTQAEKYGRLYITRIFASRRLSKVTPHMWQDCIDTACKAGLSRRTCVNIRAHINAFLKFCRLNRWEHIRLEDGDLVIPHAATPAKQKKPLTDKELSVVFTDPSIIHYNRPTQAHYINAFRFLILTGLRRGELCGLKWSDLSGKTLTVSRSINTYNEMTAGKTDNAKRSFKLTPMMAKTLDDQRAYLDSLDIHSDWIFPDKYGERPDPNQLYDHWRTYGTQHGIKCSLHELRHTFISITKSDLPMELLKAQVGHSTAMDTAFVYGHEVDGDRDRTAEIIERTMQQHINKTPTQEQNAEKTPTT